MMAFIRYLIMLSNQQELQSFFFFLKDSSLAANFFFCPKRYSNLFRVELVIIPLLPFETVKLIFGIEFRLNTSIDIIFFLLLLVNGWDDKFNSEWFQGWLIESLFPINESVQKIQVFEFFFKANWRMEWRRLLAPDNEEMFECSTKWKMKTDFYL